MARQSRFAVGSVSLVAPTFYRPRPRAGRLSGGGFAGFKHDSRAALGRFLSFDFWARYDCGNDADYAGAGAAFFLRGKPFWLAESGPGYRVRAAQSRFWTVSCLSNR